MALKLSNAPFISATRMEIRSCFLRKQHFKRGSRFPIKRGASGKFGDGVIGREGASCFQIIFRKARRCFKGKQRRGFQRQFKMFKYFRFIWDYRISFWAEIRFMFYGRLRLLLRT